MPTNLSIQWMPFLPVWVVLLLAGALLVLLAHGSAMLLRKQVARPRVMFLAALRVAIVAVFVLALLHPVVSFSRPVEQRPELMILVDTSKSMGQQGTGAGSRLEEVLPALQKGKLAERLRQRYRLHWFAFHGNASPVAEEKLNGLRPTGNTTRYSESLTTAWNLTRAAGTTPERVLLVSDGNDAGSADPAETARRLGLIVDTLAPGAGRAGPVSSEIRLAAVQCARRVLLGSETHFRVTLHCEGPTGADRTRTLRLSEHGKEVWKREVVFRRGRSEMRLPVVHRPTAPGLRQYEFRLSESASPYRVSVQVVDGKSEVLILEDTWRWEFKFLRRLLEGDPSYRCTATLARGGAFVQFAAPDRRVPLVGFPRSRADLEGFDTIILGDVDPRRWPAGLATAIAQRVREEGKSLVLIAGPNLGRLAAVPELHILLPVELTRESAAPLAGPIDVRISGEGRRSPFFFAPAAVGGPAAGAALPPLDQIYAPLRKRPAATVLLEAARKANAYGNLIVVAEHTVGRGRVLYIGTDTLWKWQTLPPARDAKSTPYARFWQQALRALTPERPASGSVGLWVQSDRSRYAVGRSVVLTAEVETDRPLVQPHVRASVSLADGRPLPLAFVRDRAVPHRFRAEFEPSSPGSHRIQAAVVSEGRTLAESTTALDVEESRSESTGAVDAANLVRLAAATGGRTIDPSRPETWPGEEETRPTVLQARTVDLWNNYSLMLLLCVLLAVDWGIRLLRGYV